MTDWIALAVASLSPVQQGFKELFGNVTQAQLGSGTPDEDQPDFDDYGDDEDDEG